MNPACYNYALPHSMGQKRETKRGKAPLVFPLLKSPFLNPRQVCAAVRLRRVLAYFLTSTPAAVRLTACPRLLLWRLAAYSCDSEESSQNIEHCTLNIEHLVSHAGKKAPLNQTERNGVKRTPRLGSSVTLGIALQIGLRYGCQALISFQ